VRIRFTNCELIEYRCLQVSLPRVGDLPRSRPRSFFPGLLVGARTGKDASQSVISFVTGVFVDRIVPLRHRNHGGPWSRPRARVVDRELVEERIGVGARKALDQVRVRTGSCKARLALEIFRLHNERSPLPVAARHPLPLTNAPVQASIQWDDASVV